MKTYKKSLVFVPQKKVEKKIAEYKRPTKKEIQFLFDKKLEVASDILGISTTNLKKLCREYGIEKWPYRNNQAKNKKIIIQHTPISLNFPNDNLPKLE